MDVRDVVVIVVLVAAIIVTRDISKHLTAVHQSLLEELEKRFSRLDKSIDELQSELYRLKRLLSPPTGDSYK